MALYHFSVRHVSRGKGQMVVASAAYIYGQRIFDSYYNKSIVRQVYIAALHKEKQQITEAVEKAERGDDS